MNEKAITPSDIHEYWFSEKSKKYAQNNCLHFCYPISSHDFIESKKKYLSTVSATEPLYPTPRTSACPNAYPSIYRSFKIRTHSLNLT